MPNRAAATLCLLVLTALACSTGKTKSEPGAGNPAAQTTGDTTATGSAPSTGNPTPTEGTPAPTGGTPAPTGGVACGPKTCPAGQVCCNESCGICTEPGGFCTQQFCEPTGCKQDGDCRTFSDYCTGCDCRALGKNDKDPTCSGPGVRCIADPCRDKQAVCKGGQCTIAK
jgi:hypothetical protein